MQTNAKGFDMSTGTRRRPDENPVAAVHAQQEDGLVRQRNAGQERKSEGGGREALQELRSVPDKLRLRLSMSRLADRQEEWQPASEQRPGGQPMLGGVFL